MAISAHCRRYFMPTLRRDGSLLSAPGFDAKSGFYSFWDGGDIGVPDAPTRTDAEAALENSAS